MTFARIATCAPCLLIAAGAAAQSYPEKAIKILVAYPPGGANDLLARLVGEKLTEAWGQPVVIENKPGANAILGTDLAAKSPPDGYTLIMGATGSHTVNAVLYDRLAYDPVKNFEPITLVASAPMVLFVHPSVPVKSVRELIALARSKPGKLFYGAGASLFNVAMELFKSKTRTDIVYVSYRGSMPAMLDVIGGQVQVGMDVIQTPLPHIREGKLRALAVTGKRRSPVAPEVPTMSEAGVADYELGAWSGLYAPAGTPKPIVAKLNAAIQKILKHPDVRQKIAHVGYEPVGLGPAEFATFMDREIKQLRKVVADANIPKLD
jgi:tripartite-type tricarboxylate transporter receptor subunit TctC